MQAKTKEAEHAQECEPVCGGQCVQAHMHALPVSTEQILMLTFRNDSCLDAMRMFDCVLCLHLKSAGLVTNACP